MRRILLLNPWITDVAAFDLWAWPLGLLQWAARLRGWGFEVYLIDCTDRAHAALGNSNPSPRDFGTGKYHSEPFETQPEPCQRAGRVFRRYGLPPEAFEGLLDDLERRWSGGPDAVAVTARMTYWGHGAADAIARCRRRWPRTPVVLGGVYATLCPDHARAHAGADVVLPGQALDTFPQWLRGAFPEVASRIETPSPDPETWLSPAFDLCHSRRALPLLTSSGCPHSCTYCAAHRLAAGFRRRSVDGVLREIRDAHEKWETADFAFYDDALLAGNDCFLGSLLDRVTAEGLVVRFHAPNGMHYGAITRSLARRMKSAGFETVRLSLESAQPERLAAWGRRGDGGAFPRAVAALREAGFDRRQIGVYIMAGMPGQGVDEVEETIRVVAASGAHPRLNEYSPIPGTEEWERALALSGNEIAEEPLWQNNSLYRTRPEVMSEKDFEGLRRLALETRP